MPRPSSSSALFRSTSDFEDYWHYHLFQNATLSTSPRYAGHVIPQAA